jgi:hypothetical protein
VSHALEGFNALAEPDERLSGSEISEFVVNEAVPDHLRDPHLNDPLYGEHIPLFRRVSGDARITIFEGGHDMLPLPALNWLAVQRKNSPSVWELDVAGKRPIADSDVALGR